MHTLTIKIPVYNAVIHVKIAPEIGKVINEYGKKKKAKEIKLEEGEEVHGLAVTLEDAKNYIVFYDILSVTSNYIAHEISHIVDFIVTEKQMEATGEARAYLTGHISEKIFDFVLRKGADRRGRQRAHRAVLRLPAGPGGGEPLADP